MSRPALSFRYLMHYLGKRFLKKRRFLARPSSKAWHFCELYSRRLWCSDSLWKQRFAENLVFVRPLQLGV